MTGSTTEREKCAIITHRNDRKYYREREVCHSASMMIGYKATVTTATGVAVTIFTVVKAAVAEK